MAANTSPIFTITPVIGFAQVSVANPNRDGTGTLETLITGDTNGTRISKITIKAVNTVTSGMIRLFLSNGTVTRLWREIPVTATTPSATATSFSFILDLRGEDALVLPASYTLKVSTEKAEVFNVFAEGGSY